MRAAFLDRDGVVNELVYHGEHGIIDSPSTPEQFRLLPGVGEAINRLHDIGFEVILVSNQPGMAKEHLSWETFDRITNKMEAHLARAEAFLDAEYYCFHHPEARLEELRVNCGCRKPEPGMLLRAAMERGIDLSCSWMIGDGLVDVKAGNSAGCRTVFLGKMKCELCPLMNEDGAKPTIIAANLLEAVQFIVKMEEEYGDIYRLSEYPRDREVAQYGRDGWGNHQPIYHVQRRRL